LWKNRARQESSIRLARARVHHSRSRLINPDALPSKSEPVATHKPVMRDADGDMVNSGNGFGKPAERPLDQLCAGSFPRLPAAVIEMRPGEQQLWRVLNASAFTYLKLIVLFHGSPQTLGLVAVDGVPMTHQYAGLVDSQSFFACRRVVEWNSLSRAPPRARRLAGQQDGGYRPGRRK